MNLTVFILLSLALVTLAKPSVDFDFYAFASEWAGTTCSHEKCVSPYDSDASSTFWNIHGLWPSDGSDNPSYCTDEKFDPSAIASLKTELMEYWSGLYSSADDFHGHEWSKHGTCSNMNQLDFFSTVLQVAKSVDMYNVLSKNNITPGNSYTCEQIADVIRTTFGVNKFELSEKHGKIASYMLCVGKDLKMQDCPNSNICSGQVEYPTFVPSKREFLHRI